MQAIIIGCGETNSPVILQNSPVAGEYANRTMVRYLAEGAVAMAKDLGYNIPIALHLDHGDSFELAKSCINNSFSSVMFDGSHMDYKKNLDITKNIVNFAHKNDVSILAL
ncbi:MAG: class II fructose-bisphosphate aldolase [Promethearchaeota archaeon]